MDNVYTFAIQNKIYTMKTITRTQAKKLYPDNLVMVTREFGYDLFIAPLNNGNIDSTDKKEDAEKWSELDGSKLGYYQAVTGYKGLKFEQA